jgi:predicted transcriptional regulator
MKKAASLTPVEFELISTLWQASEPLTVGGVLSRIRATRPVAYTTVMTQLEKMARKGILTRSLRGKAYRYNPCCEQDEILQTLVSEFISSYFEGDPKRLRRVLDKAVAPLPERPADEEEEDVSLL